MADSKGPIQMWGLQGKQGHLICMCFSWHQKRLPCGKPSAPPLHHLFVARVGAGSEQEAAFFSPAQAENQSGFLVESPQTDGRGCGLSPGVHRSSPGCRCRVQLWATPGSRGEDTVRPQNTQCAPVGSAQLGPHRRVAAWDPNRHLDFSHTDRL